MNPWVWSPPPTLCPHLIPVGRPQGLACPQPLFAGFSSGDLFLHGWSSDSVFKHFPNKVPQAVGFYNRNSSSQGTQAGGPRSRCWQGLFLLKPVFLACKQPPSVCVCAEGQISGVSCSYKDTIILG